MPGQDLNQALIKAKKYDVDISAFIAVVEGAGDDTVKLPTAANDEKFAGFTQLDGKAGESHPIHQRGGIAKAKCGATIARGKYCVIDGVTGKIKERAVDAGNVVCKALRAGVLNDVIPVEIVELDAAESGDFFPAHFAGVAAAGPVALVGAKVGDKVLILTNITDAISGAASFESVITVVDEIQQINAADLTTKKYSALLLRKP